MVVSNNHNSFLQFLSIKHNFDLMAELNEFAEAGNPETKKDKIEFLFMEISTISGIHIKQLMGTCRKSELVEWRHIARYICLVNNYGSQSFIARFLNVNHATIYSSVQLVEDRLETNDKKFMLKFNQVKHLINETNKEKKANYSECSN